MNKQYESIIMTEGRDGGFYSAPLDVAAAAAFIESLADGKTIALKPGTRRDGSPVTDRNGKQLFFLEAKTFEGRKNNSKANTNDEV